MSFDPDGVIPEGVHNKRWGRAGKPKIPVNRRETEKITRHFGGRIEWKQIPPWERSLELQEEA